MKTTRLLPFALALVLALGAYVLVERGFESAPTRRDTPPQVANLPESLRTTSAQPPPAPKGGTNAGTATYPAASSPARAADASPASMSLGSHAATPTPGSGLARPASSAVSASPAAGAAPHPSAQRSLADDLAARYASATTPADLLRDADLSHPEVRAFVVARMSEMQEAQHEAALAKAERLGIPVRIEGPNQKVSVLYDFRGDTPLYRTTLNVNAAISTGANLLRDQSAPYGLDGAGMKVGVWDEGRVRNTHREFTTSRVLRRDSATTYSDHSTHVAGTIGAAGTDPLAKGAAPQVAIDSYDWNNDYAEMTAAGAATATDTSKITISNHSYGAYFETAAEYIPYMGAYESEASTTDALAAGLPFYNIFWAAGNEQDYLLTKGGYQFITFNGLAKNIITIAAANDAVSNGGRNPAVGTLTRFSSLGPCDDGRIKPDLTANGRSVYSAVAFVPPGTGSNPTSSTTSYDSYDGTSMATPNAAGSSILIEQL